MRSHTCAAEGGAAGVKGADDSLESPANDTHHPLHDADMIEHSHQGREKNDDGQDAQGKNKSDLVVAYFCSCPIVQTINIFTIKMNQPSVRLIQSAENMQKC